MSRTSAKLCQRTPSTIATHALISFAASGYSCMASLKCLRVTMCTDQWYFTICEVVKRDRAARIEAARKSDSRSERKKQIWCRGPGTNGSRHPLHHQGRGINPSCAMSTGPSDELE